MGVYNHSTAGKGLLSAVVSDGFAEFAGVVTAIDTDPAERLRNCGRNHRDIALANPNLYNPGCSPPTARPTTKWRHAQFGVPADIVRYGQGVGSIRSLATPSTSQRRSGRVYTEPSHSN